MLHRTTLEQLRAERCSEHRKPMIIRGACQVGKTTLVCSCGEEFSTDVELNLELGSDRGLFCHGPG